MEVAFELARLLKQLIFVRVEYDLDLRMPRAIPYPSA